MKQERKKSPKGERTQKMFSFRLDKENFDWLEKQPNKGRYLNELINKDKGSHT